MADFALINENSDKVENIIVANSSEDVTISGYYLVEVITNFERRCEIGFTYDSSSGRFFRNEGSIDIGFCT